MNKKGVYKAVNNDPEEDEQVTEKSEYHSTPVTSFPSSILFWSIAILLTLSIVLNLRLWNAQSQNAPCPRETLTSFTNNASFMTLDHAYDGAWIDLFRNTTGLIELGGPVEDGQPDFGCVAMYVSHFQK